MAEPVLADAPLLGSTSQLARGSRNENGQLAYGLINLELHHGNQMTPGSLVASAPGYIHWATMTRQVRAPGLPKCSIQPTESQDGFAPGTKSTADRHRSAPLITRNRS